MADYDRYLRLQGPPSALAQVDERINPELKALWDGELALHLLYIGLTLEACQKCIFLCSGPRYSESVRVGQVPGVRMPRSCQGSLPDGLGPHSVKHSFSASNTLSLEFQSASCCMFGVVVDTLGGLREANWASRGGAGAPDIPGIRTHRGGHTCSGETPFWFNRISLPGT